MPVLAQRRLAGFRFEVQPPVLPEALPRMDIAVFVGFAAAGPLHQPVVVEDVAQFRDLFGDDAPLAWDGHRSEPASAHLAAAIRAFFRNGGRRCWVVRVADAAETDFFPVPGLAQMEGGELRPAFARARAPGSGFDDFACATALASRSLEVLTPLAAGLSRLEVRLSVADELRDGDLLRLSWPDLASGGAQLYFLVSKVSAAASSPPDGRRGRFAMQGQALGWLEPVGLPAFDRRSYRLTWTRLPIRDRQPAEDITVGAVLARDVASPPADAATNFHTLLVSAPFAPPPGTALRVRGTRAVFWFIVDEIHPPADTPNRPRPGRVRVSGRAFRWLKPELVSVPATAPLAELLTFELQVRRGDTDAVRLLDLGFAPAHPRYWNALPDDEALFAFTEFQRAVEEAKADSYADLWREARENPTGGERRFPLAGEGHPSARVLERRWQLSPLEIPPPAQRAVFIPVGMEPLPALFLGPQHSGASALERDGLKDFDARLFLDTHFLDVGVNALLGEADFLRYQSPKPRRLRGLHAALAIEEATLIAVPDAVHRGWERKASEAAPEAQPSDPLPHPAWGLIEPCDPLASPPTGETPRWDKFLKCDLRVIAAPTLRLSQPPDALGSFTLRWDSAERDVQFVLEEATERNFSGAVAVYRGADTSRTLYGRSYGHYYYRVRAEAGGETSNWSNGVVAAVQPPDASRLKPEADFDRTHLLDIHRALLRLCAARGDLMAVLALPEHFRDDDALGYLDLLKSGRSAEETGLTLPLSDGEANAFSYAAVYHPWLWTSDEDFGDLRRTPPDGAATGVLARRSLERGAWIAPANELFRGVIALNPALADGRRLDLLLAQINQITQEPEGFLTLSADTLSGDPELRPINVRRLLILLRRAALKRGADYVFEPNGPALRRLVQHAFEDMLNQLFVRGAFAGETPASSYQVVTDDSINTPPSMELGRFRVDLKVAPSVPMSFVTVRLVQTGERGVATELV